MLETEGRLVGSLANRLTIPTRQVNREGKNALGGIRKPTVSRMPTVTSAASRSQAEPARRVVLFLEGPASPFLRRVADRLVEAGHGVRRIDFCLGDAIYWSVITGSRWGERRPAPKADWYRGRQADWPAHLDTYIDEHAVTDVVMLGDGRLVHAAAVTVAKRKGVRIHILEHGYIRPDWLTLEPDGMSGASRMPRDPATLRAMAEGLPPVDFRALWRSSFLVYTLYDFAYHLPNVAFGWLAHPHYRTHGPVHPLVEYGGWVLKWLKSPLERRHLERTLPRFLNGRTPYFLFPLQLAGDYQILRHAPGADLFALVEATIASFAREAPAADALLFKVHPIDNGLAGWRRRIAGWAAAHGVADRCAVIDGGPLDALIAGARGVVTVNSTVGTATLAAAVPLITLGNAVFDVEGLTHAGTLASFWQRPTPPDPDLVEAFMRVLVDRIQLRGGFVGREAIEAGAAAVAERLVESGERLPLRENIILNTTDFRHELELFPRDGMRMTHPPAMPSTPPVDGDSPGH